MPDSDAPRGRGQSQDLSSLNDAFISKVVLSGHESAVYAVQFSPSGRNIASTSLDKTVRVWSLNTSSDNAVLGKHDMAGTDVRWLRDDVVASASLDQTVCLWALAKGEIIGSFKLDSHALCLAAAGDGGNVIYAGCSSGSVFALDARLAAPAVAAWKGEASANAVAFHVEKQVLLCGDSKGRMTVLDPRQPMSVVEEVGVSDASDSKPVSGISVLGDLVACNSYDSVLRVFDGQSRALLHSLRGHHNRNWPIRSVLFRSGHTDLVASGSASHSCYLYGPLRNEAEAPSLIQKLKGHSGNVYAVDFCKDVLVTCSADTTLRLWKKASQ